ncbi:6-phosphofructokinase [Halanaerobium hydrogeniformans]|uniref:Pyrophosphate--fructose 6-phosphate 1-phosphotransferase n=1 Tax=Halanaerobium hydrogeniformans TaxID=656519 RepID=E4RPA0_HALHG|nr:6-phosphofructokinase [Halanaerobium hydrogeniformans]ADQ13785.1 phosphofructokinase [Halanaerobium hydrogeniformans]
MKKRNCLLGQSGGPTAVINSSYRGILDQVKKSADLDRIYAMRFGLQGLLAGKYFDLTEKSEKELELLQNTPSTVIGTSRYKIDHYDENEEDYIKFFNFLEEHQIAYVFYVGGNDSMDTVAKLTSYAEEKGIDVRIMGIPKTIDNDIVITDHCPGFGSAAKYIATSVMEIARDSRVYDLKNVHIIETMGRSSGWLAAASILAANEKLYAPDFIYLPEAVFSIDKFFADVEKKMKEQKAITVVVSEGIKDKNGEYISAGKSTAHDQFGHKKLGGAAYTLKPIIKENLCNRVKAIKFDVMQRAAAHCASGRDIVEAYQVGAEAVKAALAGETGKMTAIKRISNDPYQVEIIKVEAEKVANQVKLVPDKWINEDHNGVTEGFKDYVLPLIQGDIDMETENSLPVFSELETGQ